jgi:hypothetical protein
MTAANVANPAPANTRSQCAAARAALSLRGGRGAQRDYLASMAIGKSGTPFGEMLTGDCRPSVSCLTRSAT